MISIETSLASFNAQLARYMELSKKLPNQILEKKGRDLGIKLFEGFREHQFGGNPKRKGIAAEELRQRSARGRAKGNGIRVRPSLRKRYEQGREHLTYSVRSFGQGARRSLLLSDYREAKRDGRAARKRRSALWKKTVGMELAARESGIGVLAASFLWYRRSRASRWSVSQNERVQTGSGALVLNRTGKPLGYTQVSAGMLRIVGETEGLAATDAKHSIVTGAISTVLADMETYISDHEKQIRKESGFL